MKDFSRIKLPNGLRVILAPQETLATTVLVLVEAGSEYERKDNNGLSHFLEHMVFKGTSQRPKPGMIALELDGLGAEYNAFTAQQYTGYWAKARARHASQVLELVSDMYLNPIFVSEEIEKERGVIIEEVNLEEDTPSRKIHDLAGELLYGDQPAGWSVGGRKEIIKRLKREDFVQYRRKHYVPAATCVVVAGSFDRAKTLKEIKKYFGSLPRRPKPAKPTTRESQRRPAVLAKFKDSGQSHLALSVRAFTIADKRRHALRVLAAVLGGGMSSRLWHRIREELGAAYYVHAASDLLLDHGDFSVFAGVDNQRIDEVVNAILGEFQRIKRIPVTPQELAKAKEHLIGGIILGLESSDEMASFYGGQEIMRTPLITPAQLIRRLKEVTAGQVQAVARDIFRESQLNLALIGPHKKSTEFKKLLKL